MSAGTPAPQNPAEAPADEARRARRPAVAPRHADRGPAGRRGDTDDRADRRRALLREAAVVLAVLVVVQALVFGRYWTGAVVPPWDFQGSYTTEAFAWWRDGSFFRPVQWMPYLWGGYPGAAGLQNSSWYLPVGLMSAVTPYDQHAAAVLSGLHVAFGALGVYVLARRWRLAPGAALVAMVMWHFAAGFYANASHLDIMRAYAWLPWVLLVASPRWPWRRPWAPAVGVLVLWQAVLGSYPGILIVTVYLGAAWVVLHQLTSRPRPGDYLLPLVAAGAAALLLTLVRFLPAYLTRGAAGAGDGDTMTWTWELLGTLWYGYGDRSLPNDITMRSLFLPATALVAVAFVPWRAPLARVAAGTGLLAIVIGAPDAPWSDLVDQLPALGVSRFRLSDVKPFLLLCVVVLAATGVDRVMAYARRGDAREPSRVLTPGRVVYLVALLVTALVVGAHGPFDPTERWMQGSVLVVTAALLVVAVRRASPLPVLVGSLAVLTLASGVVWATSTPKPWSFPRETAEMRAFHAPVAELLAERDADTSAVRRPARTNVLPTFTGHSVDAFFGAGGGQAFYSGHLGFDGYANLKGTPTFERIVATLQDDATRADAWAFWRAPGMVVASEGDALPPASRSRACAREAACGLVATAPESYSPEPRLVYRVVVDRPTTVALNEAYYDGWRVEACPDPSGPCRQLAVHAGDGGQLVADDLPPGSWQLSATYVQPGTAIAWSLFAVGAAGTALWTVATARAATRAPRRRRRNAGE